MTSDLAVSRQRTPSPAELRSMLGANLRHLSQRAASISALCRELGINRTQYNRYLAGESFPRPDVLHRICTYFDVDARILLEPVDQVVRSAQAEPMNAAVVDYLGGAARPVREEDLPSGFYRFVRRSFMDDSAYLQGLVCVFRNAGGTFVKGYEARAAMIAQGLSVSPANREFRGTVLSQEDGIAALVSRKNATTTSFNYLARVPSFENNFWVGYTARTVREGIGGRRVERLVYEYIGRGLARALPVARTSGFCEAETLSPFIRNLLKIGQPFA